MTDRTRGKARLIVCCTLIFALLCGVTVYAAYTSKTITVDYCDIKVYKDLVLCDLRDANGTNVEPFIYNGTTYIPVRATANLAGMGVDWDGRTHSIYLWDEMLPDDTLFLDVCQPYQTNYDCNTYLSTEAQSFKMAGNAYTDGLLFMRFPGYALFNLDGKYSSISFTLGIEDSCKDDGSISFVVDGKTVKTFDVRSGELPEKVTVPLDYGLQLKIITQGYTNIGMGNITVA